MNIDRIASLVQEHGIDTQVESTQGDLAKETQARIGPQKQLIDNVARIKERIYKLEKDPPANQQQTTVNPHKNTVWQPTHRTLGGWTERTEKDIIESAAAAFIAILPVHISSYMCKACSPRSFGTMAKVSIQPGHLAEVTSALKPYIEQSRSSRQGRLPRWADGEQSPEVGKRNTRRAVDEAEIILPKAHIDSRGTIWHDKVEAARWLRLGCKGQQGPALQPPKRRRGRSSWLVSARPPSRDHGSKGCTTPRREGCGAWGAGTSMALG